MISHIVENLKRIYAENTSKEFRSRIGKIRAFINRCISDKRKIKQQQFRNGKLEQELCSKSPIKVAFFAQMPAIWKYDALYELMMKDKRFDPLILVCPFLQQGDENMFSIMDSMYNAMVNKGYKVLSAYKADGSWIDVKNEIKPDIIFYCYPYKSLIPDQYYITSFPHTLTCYVPYAFLTVTYKHHFDSLFHNLLWRHFEETQVHKKISEKVQYIKGKNVCVSGYPGCDLLIDHTYCPVDSWKIKDRKLKRIIWAPHHSIEGDGHSVFLSNCELIYDLALKYKTQIQIAFKPHPVLKYKLYERKDWGKEKTDAYYNAWRDLDNGLLNEGGYIDLFLTSDGMIHDSASFLIEYLYTQKPVMLCTRSKLGRTFNSIGKMAYDQHYLGKTSESIKFFIEEVIIVGNDEKAASRKKFFEEYLLPPNGNSASKNILNEIIKYI